MLGFCKLAVGQPEAAIPLLPRSIYLDPLAPANRYAHRRLGQAHLLLGSDAEALEFGYRALAEGSLGSANKWAACDRLIASAHGLAGQRDAACRALAAADRLRPFATVQTRFRRKIHHLTNGNLSAPIVAYYANAERFTRHNLALRLVALGYAQVYWYRGGREAWQVAGLPDTPLELQSW